MKAISGNPYIKIEEEKIKLDNFYLDEIFQISKTPFMIILENRIRNNIETFNTVFQSYFGEKYFGFYSFKANFLPEVCSIVNSEEFGAEVISLPELELALKIGFPSNKIIAGGPYLNPDFIDKAIQNEVREIVAYNIKDIIEINKKALDFNKVQNICLRINSNKYGSRLGMNFNGDNDLKLKEVIHNSKNIKVTTLLSHFSTQMNSLDQFKKNLNTIIQAKKILEKLGIDSFKINLGGGFPEAVIMHKKQLELIASKLKDLLDMANLKYEEVYFEPGRYLVGDAGIFVAKVINSQKNRWILLNLGTNVIPKFAKCPLRFYNVSRINSPHKYKTSIAGIVPTDQDVLVKDYFFTKEINEGDFILITNVGAYTLTFSNRFPYALPPIFKINDSDLLKIFDPKIDRDFSIKI